MTTPDYQFISTTTQLDAALTALRAAPRLGLDLETTGLDPYLAKPRLLQLAAPAQPCFVIDLFAFDAAALAPLLALLTAPDITKIAHNAKFDAKFLLHHYGIRLNSIFDTYLASQLIAAGADNQRHGLAAVAQRYLGVTLDKEEQRSDWSGALTDAQLHYAARDALTLLPLHEQLQARLEALELTRVAQLEFDAVLSIAAMELAGMALDADCWRAQVERVRVEYETVADELKRVLGGKAPQQSLFDLTPSINLDSPAQVQAALQQHGISVKSTREWHLQQQADAHPVIKQLLHYRHLSKALSAYGLSFLEHLHPVTGRIHADFRQLGTPTGRLSAAQPNVQQVPHETAYRACFRAPAGRKLIVADYSQIEMRILADFAQDNALLAAFDSGVDLHRTTSAQMLGLPLDAVTPAQREAAKRLNYGLVYGMGARGLTNQIHVTVEEAELLIEQYFRAYPGVARWLRQAADTALRDNQSRTASGRLWIYQFDRNDAKQFSALQRVGKNTPIQGTAADLFKRAMTLVDAALIPYDARIVNSIHDEIVVECAANIVEEIRDLLVEAMTQAGREYLTRVPIIVEAIIAEAWLKH